MLYLKDYLKSVFHSIDRHSLNPAITIFTILCCAHVTMSVAAATSAMAPVLDTRIFVQNDEHPGFNFELFDVSEAGEAILRVVNGAKVGAAPGERMEDTEITLNGQVVVNQNEFDKHTNVLNLRVPLLHQPAGSQTNGKTRQTAVRAH